MCADDAPTYRVRRFDTDTSRDRRVYSVQVAIFRSFEQRLHYRECREWGGGRMVRGCVDVSVWTRVWVSG